MRYFTKRKSRLRFQVIAADQISAHGGQVLIEAICQRFGLWDKLRRCQHLDPRKRRDQGFAPEAIVAQILCCLTSGGVSLADAERVGRDQVLLETVGLDKGADQSTLGEFLREHDPQGVEELRQINQELVVWIMENAAPNRYLRAGCLDVFFDATEIEVLGSQFEGARVNYAGELALSLQTLWAGPLWVDFVLDGAVEASAHLPEFLLRHRRLWSGRKSHFYADSASSGADYLGAIEAGQFSSWSVSYNRWTEVLDRQAAAMPEGQWSAPVVVGKSVAQYLWQRHQPGKCARAHMFATVRQKGVGDLLWRYGHIVWGGGEHQSAQLAMEQHRLKGAMEQRFSEILSDLDLHHPPCQKLVANQMFYALAMLAYNLLVGLKLLELPEEAQGLRVRSVIRFVLTAPVKVTRHARYVTATISVARGWLQWWRRFIGRWVPKRRPGRPAKEEVGREGVDSG